MVKMKYCTIKEAANRWGVSEQLVRRYCRQKRIPGLTQENGAWLIPAKAKKPQPINAPPAEDVSPLVRQIKYQCSKNNHFGIYEYIQVNLAYSSCRMASNRLTREQVLEIYRTGKVSIAFEPMKVDDVVEISNHFRAGRYMIETITEALTPTYISKLHCLLFRGTVADLDGIMFVGEYRKTPDKYGVAAPSITPELGVLLGEYEMKPKKTLQDILDFHVRFEKIHPFKDGNGRVGRLLMVKECLQNQIEPFVIDDKRRGEYNRGIDAWETDPLILTTVVEQAQARFRNYKDTCQLMEYCRPSTGRGAR